ncbi:hypothetical protein GCM10027184_55290 [Saccharothrix stipae]
MCRTGIAWEYLPHDFPPYRTVYDYYAKWETDGTTKALHGLLRGKVRRRPSVLFGQAPEARGESAGTPPRPRSGPAWTRRWRGPGWSCSSWWVTGMRAVAIPNDVRAARRGA